MKLITGLGNPGEKYKNSRHNLGFILLDHYVNLIGGVWHYDKEFDSLLYKNGDRIFAKPQTYMNNSGSAVSKIVNYYKIDLNDIVIIHDDIDLDFGQIRFKIGSNSAGHKGVQDIIDKLGSAQFNRLRVGIGRPANINIEIDEWVLMDINKENIIELVSHIDIDEIIPG